MMLDNRLRKNLDRLRPWASREKLDAFRLYDRDIPELPWTIDLYGPRVLVCEHVTPVSRRQTAAEREAERRAVVEAVCAVLGVREEAVSVKARERHLSAQREARGSEAHEFSVGEHGLRFLVNLDDYLDTGLFLDHRLARRRVGGQSAAKRVLNLFCYTGAFTVYAAAGGARETVSVDLSATYLSWAGRNLALNGLTGGEHRLVRADAFDYLRDAADAFDLIVLDPPTLSRSKAGRSFDVQEAHPELIRRSLARLAPGGTLFFSTNYRRFALDEGSAAGRTIREITRETLPRDFRSEAHRCWEIS